MNDPILHVADFQFVQRCLEGDEAAVSTLVHDYRAPTVGFLVNRGAPVTTAEYLVDGVWSECLQRDNGRPGRLQSYNGKCSLQTFLNTIVFNKYLTGIRPKPSEPPDPGPTLPEESDNALVNLLSQALIKAFSECSAEHYVILQLLYIDRLKSFELARMFGCGEPWMSRTVKKAKQEMRDAVERNVKARDPWIDLKWEDFVELCSAASPLNLGLEET